jgi:hypothetical protein
MLCGGEVFWRHSVSATVPLLWRHYVSATSLVFGGLSKKIKKQKNKSQPLRPASFAFPPRPFFHWNPCPEEGGGATAAVFTVCRPSRGVWRPCVCHPQTSQAAPASFFRIFRQQLVGHSTLKKEWSFIIFFTVGSAKALGQRASLHVKEFNSQLFTSTDRSVKNTKSQWFRGFQTEA